MGYSELGSDIPEREVYPIQGEVLSLEPSGSSSPPLCMQVAGHSGLPGKKKKEETAWTCAGVCGGATTPRHLEG